MIQLNMLLQLINTDIKMHMACPGFVNTTMIRRAQKQAVSFRKYLTLQPSRIRVSRCCE